MTNDMNNDTGTGWVQRWFAKPLVKDSIPSRVSIHSGWTDTPRFKHFGWRQAKYWMGRRVARWVIRAPSSYRSFRAGLLYDIETTHALSPSMMARLNDANRIAEPAENNQHKRPRS